MADLGPTTDKTKIPRYYEGVYSNERTISSYGDVTPTSLRPPISRGLFNLPRYVPKYTINSRLHGRYADEVDLDSKTGPTFDRKYKDAKFVDDDSLKDVPFFPEKSDDVETSRSNRKKREEVKGQKKSRNEVESERPRKCCAKCSSQKCCTPKCCTSKCRRIACVFVVVSLVAAALLALALGLYFGYFMQFGDPDPMMVNFTVTNFSFPDYLSNLNHPQTLNLTNAICDAFKKTLENVSQNYVDLSSCSAASYTSGSIYAIFNIEVRHRRAEFADGEGSFVREVRNRLTTEFNLTPAGYFAKAVSRTFPDRYKLIGDNFNVVLNGISPGQFSLPNTLTNSTVTTTTASGTTTTKSTKTSSTFTSKATTKNSATSTGDVTTTYSGTNNATQSGNATNCENNTGVNPKASATNCSRNSGVTSHGATSTTGSTSSLTKTTEPGRSSLATASAAKTSLAVASSSSAQTDYSTIMKPWSTQAFPPSSTNSPTIQTSSIQTPTIESSSTQSPTISQKSTQHLTTAVPAPTTTATVHLSVSTTVVSTAAATPIPHMRQATTSRQSSTSESHLTTSNAALTLSSH